MREVRVCVCNFSNSHSSDQMNLSLVIKFRKKDESTLVCRSEKSSKNNIGFLSLRTVVKLLEI
jgi:hypothetical protein